MKKVGLVLSGGAARGAYEVGVIKAILPHLEKVGGVKILCGTSVGAINSVYLASHLHLPTKKVVEGLEHYWINLKKENVFYENWKNKKGLIPFLASFKLGQADYEGLLNYSPLKEMIENEVFWGQIDRNIQNGVINALTVSGTSVTSGRSIIFYESLDDSAYSFPTDPRIKFAKTKLSADHVIASCSVPIFFKPIELTYEVDGKEESDWFFDGGVRLNTPLQPAITLGADALIIIGLHYLGRTNTSKDIPGLLPNIGNLMNAIFLDHIRNDVQSLHKVNDILEAINDEKVISRINDYRNTKGGSRLRFLPDVFVTPSKIISEIAEEIWDSDSDIRADFKTLDWLFKFGKVKKHVRGDILSYFFFNPSFVQALIDLGYKDATSRMNTKVWDPNLKKEVKIIDKFLRYIESSGNPRN